jgi:hypothetical protein
VYSLGFLAVDFLTVNGDLGPLRSFWTALRDQEWGSAFEDAFGRSVADFESGFEAHRQANFPRHRGELRGRVADADELGRGAFVWACERGYGDCYFAQVAPDGAFQLAVPDGRYTLQFGFDPEFPDYPGRTRSTS